MSLHIFISDLHLCEERPDLTRAFFQFLDDLFPLDGTNAISSPGNPTPGTPSSNPPSLKMPTQHNKSQMPTAQKPSSLKPTAQKSSSQKNGQAASAIPQSLYILGDLFEVWLGDDDKCPFNVNIMERLAAVPADKFIMHGNRDFLIGNDFCQAINATLLADPCVHNLDGLPVLLMHGDSLCTRDLAYMKARALFRSPEFQADFLGKSLEQRAAYATEVRGQSKQHTQQHSSAAGTASDIMDVTAGAVVQAMSDHQVTTLIHGHTHRPGTHALEVNAVPCTRFVLGDWHSSTWYLAMQDGKPRLIHYSF